MRPVLEDELLLFPRSPEPWPDPLFELVEAGEVSVTVTVLPPLTVLITTETLADGLLVVCAADEVVFCCVLVLVGVAVLAAADEEPAAKNWDSETPIGVLE
jgi:hypothetical protein